MLEVQGLKAAYGRAEVLFDVSLRVDEGEVVALLGRNGMGKTTTIHAVMGMMAGRQGNVRFAGRDLGHLPAHAIARAGLGLVPEGRRVFPNLTVRENLIATATDRGPWTLDRVLALFPSLRARLGNYGNQLSGGEQQMLAIGRALLTNPRLLILDEATEGLAPLIRAEIWRCLGLLKQTGQAILIVDKNIAALRPLADRHYVLEKGRVAWEGDSAALAADAGIAERYLGV